MHAVVTTVTVQDMPFVKETEERQWDLTSGPDLYYQTYDPDDELLYTSDVVSDVRPHDLPLSLSADFAIRDLFTEYYIVLLDSDLTHNEVICRIAFKLGALANDRPHTARLDASDTTLKLSLEWRE